ncbi:hypothetical protein Ahia01_000655600 [Argonauta hians]
MYDETLEQDEAHDQQGSKLKTGSTPSLSSSSPSSPSSPSSSKSTVGGASNADRTTGEKETGGGGGGGGIDFRRKPCPLEDKKCPIHVTANASQGSSPSPEERSGTSRTTTNATKNQRQPEIFVIGGEGEREEIRGSEDKERKAIQPVDVGFGQTCTNNERERNSSARTKDENDSSENQMISNNPPNGDNSPLNFKTQQKNKTFVIDPNDIDKCMKTFEKMIDQNLKTLASGAKEEPDDSRAYNELKEKLFGEDFEKQIDSFLNDI